MPFINGKFYMNPTYGSTLEAARNEASARTRPAIHANDGGHWVTINHQHVLIHEDQASRPQSPPPPKLFTGDATYYNLPGKKTASGSQFDPDKMAAAMTGEKVKLGQTVVVTYTDRDKNGKTTTQSISVVVNDRGPFARDADGKAKQPLQPDPSGVIELTPTAFRKLVGTTKVGRVSVAVAVPSE